METENQIKSRGKFFSTILILLVIVFFVGFRFGQGSGQINSENIEAENTTVPSEISDVADFAPFWKAWKIIDQKFIYANPKEASTTPQEMVWGAIEGLTNSLNDPHTVFLPPAETKSFESDIAGNFEGVGIEIGIEKQILTVIAALNGTPAYKAGILPGDKILEIDAKSVINTPVEKAVQLIRGKKGTTVTFTILREGKKDTLKIGVIRDVITIPTIKTKQLENGVFLIQLFNFSANSANDFREALREFIDSGNIKLIVDLRGNPGGYLESAVDMASWFLPAGKIVVKEDFGGKEEDVVYRSKGYDIFNENLKLVILIDKGSASASEILAGALNEHGEAILIGTNTYGKGSVQELIKITPETSLKVTVARWLTPKGNSISDGGLKPDIEVKVTEADIQNKNDPQLNKALEFLK